MYALSNNHVYAVQNTAPLGSSVMQPGAFDDGSLTKDFIGTLATFRWLDFSGEDNEIDAAIVLVLNNADRALGTSTPSDGYGTPRIETITAAVNMRVMKYGRTTGQTKGRAQGINATVNVGYGDGKVALFVGQIVIGGGGFSAGGDSGSLIVVEKGEHARKPVGLLFAGGGGSTIANPIDAVLTAVGVTIDGEGG